MPTQSRLYRSKIDEFEILEINLLQKSGPHALFPKELIELNISDIKLGPSFHESNKDIFRLPDVYSRENYTSLKATSHFQLHSNLFIPFRQITALSLLWQVITLFHFRASIRAFRLARQWKTKERQ